MERGGLMRGLKLMLKIILIILAVPVAIIGLWLAIFAVSIHFKTEGKITAALESGFPGADVSIIAREDFDPANEVCFDVAVRPKSGGPAKRAVVMVSGGDDGGVWFASRVRFSSMRECKKGFSRG